MPRRINPPLPAMGTAAYAITLSGTCDAGIWLTTFDYIMSSNVQINDSEKNVSVSFLLTNEFNFLACLSNQYILTQCKVACLTNVTRIPFVQGLNVSGSVVQDALPSFVAGKLLKRTLTKGQHGRGRNLIPGVPVTFTTPATNPEILNGPGIFAYGGLATSLNGPGVVDGAVTGEIGLVTRPHVAGTPATLGQLLTLITVAPTLSTVRRRRIGVGR